jgi:hypothetical protein
LASEVKPLKNGSALAAFAVLGYEDFPCRKGIIRVASEVGQTLGDVLALQLKKLLHWKHFVSGQARVKWVETFAGFGVFRSHALGCE